MRLKAILRRARRLKITDVWSACYSTVQHSISSTSPPVKHIKIDDEESQYDEEPLTLTNRRHPSFSIMKLLFLTLLAILALLLSLAYILYRPPNLLVRYLQYRNPSVIFHVPLLASRRVLALTIDDAPSSETAKILDLLKLHSAKATFFIIGSQAIQHPELLARIHAEGHELGNHAWTDDPSFKLPLSELERQIKEVEALLPGNANGMKYFRPGSGWFNGEMKERVEGLGYKLALGSVYPHDPQVPHPRWNARHVLSMVRPGSVVIMHDRRDWSVEQLQVILEGMEKKKYAVQSLGGLLKIAEEVGKKSV